MSDEDAEATESTRNADAEADRPSETSDQSAPNPTEATDGTTGDGAAGGDAVSDTGDGSVADAETAIPEDLASRVAEYDEDLAASVQRLQSRTRDLEARVETLESDLEDSQERVEDLTDRLKRKQADFQNYKKRAKKRQEQLEERATEDLVERVVTVRDNLVRALDQEEDADIRPGIESTLSEFDRILEDENVSPIEPAPGDEVDPHRHEVMMRVDSEEPGGTVADVFQPGYEMGDKVIRAAQVTVSKDE
jgi:molecular chaperone GrpE